jgi:aerobic carbon-monoxide dehydrogenase medium subunit
MKPAPFEYECPSTLPAALALLADQSKDTRILAGGQSLVPMMNFRLARPERLIDINRIKDLDYIRREGDEIVIGALARHASVMVSPVIKEACPLVEHALHWVAHHTIRARGTLCGNLCHADPASEMPAVMQTLGAVMVAHSKAGTRRIPADDFFVGIYRTTLAVGEMLVEVRIPVRKTGETFGFAETNVRKGDFAICCVAAAIHRTADAVISARVTVAGVADRAMRLKDVEAAIVGKRSLAIDLSAVGRLAAAHSAIQGDQRNPTDYKRDLVAANVGRAVAEALTQTA